MQPDHTLYLWYDPKNGDTWTQEAVDEGFARLIALSLYTKDRKMTKIYSNIPVPSKAFRNRKTTIADEA